MTIKRFGKEFDAETELDFGEWGALKIGGALEELDVALLHFDREEVKKKELARFAMVQAARRYYDGNHAKPLKVKAGQFDDNVVLNLCRPLVDDSVSWLFGDPEYDDRGVLAYQADGLGRLGIGIAICNKRYGRIA